MTTYRKSRKGNGAHATRGFTLLIAVLVAGIVLSIGLAILNLTIKEFTLSSIVRESQIAFSAADAGMECALYWDGLPRDRFNTGAAPATISCGGADVSEYGGGSTALVGGNSYGVPNEFEVRWGTPEVCARVEVTKHDDGTLGTCPAGVTCTVVVSRGYNTCDVNHPRAVERALRARY